MDSFRCSVGLLTNETCKHDFFQQELKDVKNLSKEDEVLLKFRVSGTIENICLYHEHVYLKYFTNYFGTQCCNPTKIHKKKIQKSLRTISLNVAKKFNLIPGKSLCSNCYAKLIRSLETEEPNVNTADASEIITTSIMPNIRKYPTNRKRKAIDSNALKLTKSVKRKLYEKYAISDNESEFESENNFRDRKDYKELINNLKQKYKNSSKDDKLKILSILPDSWGIDKICTEFSETRYMVMKVRKLKKNQGVFPVVEKKLYQRLDPDTIKTVQNFYQSNEISRMMPGKKDCIVIKTDEGCKETKQKRLMLLNINEAYRIFKTEFNLQIGISKFSFLRPKWCVFAGSPGTHNVCLCIIHQNCKLMVQAMDQFLDYKTILNSMVCDVNNYACMTDKCNQCPGGRNIDSFIITSSRLQKITYKQWVSTDRCNMVTVEEPIEDYKKKLIQKLSSLKKHHFIADAQTQYFKNRKSSLNSDEIIIQLDFSENFAFIVQDAVQGCHWMNDQVTLFPIVIYEIINGSLHSQSFCILSDCLQHSSTAVNTFLKKISEFIRGTMTNIKKVIYFSDGAVTHFKNRKNLINLCYHFEDFQLDAEWNFFATAHGKGSVDGIGATVKRTVSRASLQRANNCPILNPADMFQFCDKHIKGIKFFFVSNKEVLKREKFLKRRYDKSIVITNTREHHRVVPFDKTALDCYEISDNYNFQRLKVSK